MAGTALTAVLAARLPPPAAATEVELDEVEMEAVDAAQQRTLVKKKAAKAAQLAAAPKKPARREASPRRDMLLRSKVRSASSPTPRPCWGLGRVGSKRHGWAGGSGGG